MQPVIQKFRLRFELFDELIKGCEMDLDTNRYENFEQLELYCHRVASVVGLLSIEIFGYQNPACRDYAIYLGKALQLTNILRDVKTDAARGRIYLPLAEFEKIWRRRRRNFAIKILRPHFANSPTRCRPRKGFLSARAKNPAAEDRKSMVAAELMGSVYWQLLQKLERGKFNVFGAQPLKLSKPQKLALIFQSWLRFVIGSTSPSYGQP